MSDDSARKASESDRRVASAHDEQRKTRSAGRRRATSARAAQQKPQTAATASQCYHTAFTMRPKATLCLFTASLSPLASPSRGPRALRRKTRRRQRTPTKLSLHTPSTTSIDAATVIRIAASRPSSRRTTSQDPQSPPAHAHLHVQSPKLGCQRATPQFAAAHDRARQSHRRRTHVISDEGNRV